MIGVAGLAELDDVHDHIRPDHNPWSDHNPWPGDDYRASSGRRINNDGRWWVDDNH
jgi:hypothetical protein